MILELLQKFGFLFLLAVFVSSVLTLRLPKERRRSDLVLLALLLLAGYVIPKPAHLPLISAVTDTLYTLSAYALLRIAQQFRRVPGWLLTFALVSGSAYFALRVLWPDQGRSFPGLMQGAVSLVLFVVPAAIFVLEARRSVGIRRMRLMLGAAGTILLTAPFVVLLIKRLGVDVRGAEMYIMLAARGAFLSFFLAFSPWRWIVRRWQRNQHARYLQDSATRAPEERGRFAPLDLFGAAERTAGGALTLVAIRPEADAEPFEVRIASASGLKGRLIPLEGVMGEAVRDGRPVIGTTAEAGDDLSDCLAGFGETLLVAPIVADGRTWGLVAVVHRRGALFPEDDLDLLGQLARTAAVALDHARLIEERRARERAEADRRMREMETRVDLMLESIKDYGMFVLDAHGHVATWQPGAQHLFGHSAGAITGTAASALFQMSDDAFGQWLAEACERGHAEREGTCARQDGSTFVGITTIRPLVGDPRGVSGFVAVTQDVTARRLLEERSRQGQKLEAIGRLAGGVAHDFNNLLMVILGHADWLERGLRGDPRKEEVAGIQQAAERAADLTRRLLSFSRHSVLQPSRLNLGALVADTLPMLRRLIGDGIEVVDASSTSVPDIIGDHTQLQQVLLNLVANARDAMPAGGTVTVRTAEVWLGAATPGGATGRHAMLEVADTGVGMDAETKRLAFEPFFTTKDVGKGTGLGLSTVYGVVQQLGGRIQLESEPGRGTTFRLYLPEVSVADPSGLQPASLESLIGPDTLM